MANYETIKIRKVEIVSNQENNFVKIGIRPHTVAYCKDRYPFNSYRLGEYVEIDLDRIFNFTNYGERLIDDESIIRRVSSSAVVPSSSTDMTIGSTTITRENYLAVARGLDEMVEQSGGRNEYTAHIEVRDSQNRPIKFSLSSKRTNN